MAKPYTPDYAAELQKSFDQWDHYHAQGGCDPFYTDGQNLNNIRRHILFERRHLEENPTLFGFPEAYYREVPPEVDPGYMARPDEIRAAARASLEAYGADLNYHFILDHRDEIPEKMRGKLSVDAVLGYVSGLEISITEDDLVALRRHRNAETRLSSFESCAQRMRDFLSEDAEFVDGQAVDEPEDEVFEEEPDEDYGEVFDDEPEEGFGGMTMKM